MGEKGKGEQASYVPYTSYVPYMSHICPIQDREKGRRARGSRPVARKGGWREGEGEGK